MKATLEQHYRPEAAAARLGLAVKTLYKLVAAGEIRPVVKPSRRVLLIPESALVRWVDSHRVEVEVAQ
jgi:excisionase family DNA binding protein